MRPPLANQNGIQVNDLRQRGTELTAHGQCAESNDADLSSVIEAWDRLPEALRAGIVAMGTSLLCYESQKYT